LATVTPSPLRPSEAIPTISAPESFAAGPAAIITSMKRTLGAAGPHDAVTSLLRINQVRGFDCPGCAWPERADHKVAEFCESGAKAIAEETTRKRADALFFAQHSVAELLRADDFWLGQQGRLTHPIIRRPDSTHFEPVTWTEAYDFAAQALRSVTQPDEAVFYTSGRTSNEAAYCYQLFARAFGTNNLPDCSNMCHEPTSIALKDTIGIGKASVTFDDFDHADLIIILGQNPGTNAPRMLTTLEDAKRRGASIVAINPMPEAGLMRFKNPQRVNGIVGNGTALADLYCPISLNGDHALMQVLNKRLVSDGDVDKSFISTHTEGYNELVEHLASVDEESLLAMTGLDRTVVDSLYRKIRSTNNIIVCWAMGITQHRNAVDTIQEIVNFSLLKGLVGRRGAGLCPVRGHSNVQGDRTMGVSEKPDPHFMERLHQEFHFTPPTEPGVDVVSAIEALEAGDVRVLMSLGGNLSRVVPDTTRSELALANCALSIQVATKLNRTHLIAGQTAIVLPTLGRTERDVRNGEEQSVSVEDTFGFVHPSRGVLAPVEATLVSEVEIVCKIAMRTVPHVGAIPWMRFAERYGDIRDSIARTVPGFEHFNARLFAGVGFALPHPPRLSQTFPTDSGFAKFTVNLVTTATAPKDGFLLQTLRSHDQFNSTIYGLSDRYRGVEGGRLVVFVNPIDLDRCGYSDGDYVDIVTDDGQRRASGYRVVSYPVSKGSVAGYYPELNVLVGLDAFDKSSRTPAFKSLPVRFEPASSATNQRTLI
jgi:molybdopterin-dependent oxidoreductase alpha subunit